jgi:DNA-binding HxlR family transcriptional regulator
MTRKRSYGDQCGIARALDVVGERWALLVVRELLHGPRRFTDLRNGLPGIAPDVLSQRLRDLEEAGVLGRRTLEAPAASRVYELTDRGRALESVLLELGRWGTEVPLPPEGAFSPDSMMLALRTVFDSAAAEGADMRVELRFPSDRFSARLEGGELKVSRGGDEEAAVRLQADTGTLAELLWRGRDLGAAVASGDVALEGPEAEAERFLGLFAQPA